MLVVVAVGCGVGAAVLAGGHHAPAAGRLLAVPASNTPTAAVSVPLPGPPTTGADRYAPLTPIAVGGDGAGSTSVPTQLTVPAIGVSAAVIPLGLAADGSLVTPSDTVRVGWYDGGPVPGQAGPAVLEGHVDSTSGPGVFYRLRDLVPGDRITVRHADGTSSAFVVQKVQQYAKDAFPTSEVYGPTGGAALRLITCGGSFDATVHHYRDNVVVYATAS